ncbi:MAG: hypothetical protein ABIF12_01015 [bacterium]
MTDNNDKKNIQGSLEAEGQGQTLSSEELKQKQELFLKEFLEKNTEELDVSNISFELKKEISRVLEELEKAKEEVAEKRMVFVERYKVVENKLETLTKSGGIKLNEDDFKKSQDSFVRYEDSLKRVFAEISGDIDFYSTLISQNPPKTIKVFKNSTGDANLYLDEKLKSSKRYIKNMLKDVRVSSSRYNVGLQEQIRKLDYLASYLDAAKKKNK